jgi:diguanylate cyclase (GGDEF)-like protein
LSKNVVRRTAEVVARYGGEEIALTLPETDAKGAIVVAEKAREVVLTMRIPHGRWPIGPFVSISGGVAAANWQGEDTALVAAADKLLYETKRAGRNRIFSAHAVAA